MLLQNPMNVYQKTTRMNTYSKCKQNCSYFGENQKTNKILQEYGGTCAWPVESNVRSDLLAH